MRRLIPWWVLVLVFVVLPIVEIYVLIQIGQVIGAWWTVLLLVADAFLGSYLVKREGSRTWAALQQALRDGRMPHRELADGALVLVGGTLLVTPGFVTDIFGFFLILPLTRPVSRRLLGGLVARKLLRSGSGRGPGTGQRPGPDSVVQGEVVD
ncbi:MAG: FxsA family protein [Nocardioidaceae bacterium]